VTTISNDFYEDVERPRGGRWVKSADFSTKGQKIGGTLVGIEVRQRTDPEGNVVVGRKSGQPRKIYRVTFEIPAAKRDGDEDDGLRIWDANEAGQTAISDAYKAVGTKELIGGKFEAVVTADAPDSFSQATYKARFEKAPKTVELDDDPFADNDDEPF
jgi:hypothetical protein